MKGWRPGDLALLYVPHQEAVGPPGWTERKAGHGTLFYRHLSPGDVTAAAQAPEPFNPGDAWSAVVNGMTRIEDVVKSGIESSLAASRERDG